MRTEAQRISPPLLCILIMLLLVISDLQSQETDPKNHAVSLRANQLPLITAVLDIANQANVSVTYSDQLVEDKIITCNFQGLPLNTALSVILENTGVAFKWVKKDRLVLLPIENIRFTLSGYILDAETQEALPFANISVKGLSIGTISTREGHFTLFNLPNASCELTVDYMGYASQTIAIDPASVSERLLIQLNSTVHLANAVNVSAENDKIIKISTTPSKLTISPQNVAILPFLGDKDIFRSLQLMPGVLSGNDGDAGLYIRGGLPTENLVQLDGITLYHLDHSLGFLSAFNNDAVKDVQVYKGGFPAKYGGRVSGVIDMTAKNGNLRKPAIQIGVNRLSASLLAETPLFGKGALMIAGRRSYTTHLLGTIYKRNIDALSPQLDTLVPTARLRADTSTFSNYYDLHGKFTLFPSENSLLSWSYYQGGDEGDLNQSTSVNGPFFVEALRLISNSTGRSNANWGNRGYSFKWAQQLTPRFNHVIVGAYSNYFTKEILDVYLRQSLVLLDSTGGIDSTLQSSTTNSDFNSKSNLIDRSLRSESIWLIHPDHKLEFGLEASSLNINNRSTSNSTFYSSILQGDSTRSETFSQKAQQSLMSAYLQDSWQLTERWHATIGLRSSYNLKLKKNFLEPRIAVNYNLNDNLILKSAFGEYHQFVFQVDDTLRRISQPITWDAADNSSFKPVESRHFVLGSQYSHEVFLIDLEFYHKQLDGLFADALIIGETPEGILNLHKGYSQGFDLLIQKKSGSLTGWLSYGYNQNRIRRTANGQMVTVPTLQEKPHNFKLVLNKQVKRWQLTTSWHYASGKPYTIPQFKTTVIDSNTTSTSLVPASNYDGLRLPASHRLDMAIMRFFKAKAVHGTISLSVVNVYNRKNIWLRFFDLSEGLIASGDVLSLGRTPTLSLELTF
ncbi:MAG: TonB-dependent receptor [Calditrichia bacterium]